MLASFFPLQLQPGAPLGCPCPSPYYCCLPAACHTWHRTQSLQRKNPKRQTPALGAGRGKAGERNRKPTQPSLPAPHPAGAAPGPPATGTPCRDRMEDLGKPGPASAIPVPRLGAGSCLWQLGGASSFLYLRVKWGCCRGAAMETHSLLCLLPSWGANGVPGGRASAWPKMERA